MPQPPLRRELAVEAVERVEAELRAGCVPMGYGQGKSAVEAAAQRAVDDGWVNALQSFQTRLRAAKDRYGLEPDWTLYRPGRAQQPPPRVLLPPAPAPAA